MASGHKKIEKESEERSHGRVKIYLTTKILDHYFLSFWKNKPALLKISEQNCYFGWCSKYGIAKADVDTSDKWKLTEKYLWFIVDHKLNRSQPCYAVAKKCKHKSAETEAQARRHVYRVQLQAGDSEEKIMRLTSDSESMITEKLNELEVYSPVKTL